MEFRRYLASLMGLVAFVLGSIATYNAVIDPHWFFQHRNPWNQNQSGFDERQQKSNRIAFGAFDYDALLLGSSRSTYINQADLLGYRAYNYAASGMRPEEYLPYLEFAKSRRGSEFRTVFIGIDFFASNRSHAGGAASPSQYFANARNPLYRAEMLVSFSTFRKSRENARNIEKECDCYNRDNVKSLRHTVGEEKQQLLQQDLSGFRQRTYARYTYDESLPGLWRDLVRGNPQTRFAVFTTPISAEMFRVLVQSGRLADLERWLRDAVAEFGEVTDFMGVNSVTSDIGNYQDATHFYPEVGTLIAHRMVDRLEGVPPDFGVRVTARNLEQHLAALRVQARRIAST